jgi:lipid-binding SYLF domain-containing protein
MAIPTDRYAQYVEQEIGAKRSYCARRLRGRRLAIELGVLLLIASCFNALICRQAWSASASEINSNADQALTGLYQNTPGAYALAQKSRGILVFPSIVKAGFIVAGQFGDGVLRIRNQPAGYYRSVAASFGYQAGAQSYGYVLFFMDNASLRYLKRTDGWELGTGPSLVVLDKGFGKNLSTTTLQKGVYAFIFNQKGLMAGIGIQGSKITRIYPNP